MRTDRWLATDDAERLAVAKVELDLHRDGWASFVTIEREAAGWRKLAATVDAYGAMVEEYTNELCSRDALEIMLTRCSGGVRARLESHVFVSDELFRAKTVLDAGRRLHRYYRIRDSDGWWWHRIPVTGPLLDLL